MHVLGTFKKIMHARNPFTYIHINIFERIYVAIEKNKNYYFIFMKKRVRSIFVCENLYFLLSYFFFQFSNAKLT